MNIAILGCGNMAYALMLPISEGNNKLKFHCYTPSFHRAKKLSDDISGSAYKELADIPQCDLYIIACKPQQFLDLSEKLKNYIAKDSVILSIMAAVLIDDIYLILKRPVVRLMPNLAVKIKQGVNLLYFQNEFPQGKKEKILNLTKTCGRNFLVDEEWKLDKLTSLSGCAPGYFFEFIDILVKKIISFGIDRKQATSIAKETFKGSSLFFADSELSPRELVNMVASKKGVTEEILKSLDENSFEKIVSLSIDKGCERLNSIQAGLSEEIKKHSTSNFD